MLIGSDGFQDEHGSESPYRCAFHRPDPGPGPAPEPDPPQPPYPFPNPPIPPEQPVLTSDLGQVPLTISACSAPAAAE